MFVATKKIKAPWLWTSSDLNTARSTSFVHHVPNGGKCIPFTKYQVHKYHRGVTLPVPESILGIPDYRPRSCQLSTKAQHPIISLLCRHAASRGFHHTPSTRSLPPSASHISRQQPFGCSLQRLRRWSLALLVGGRFVLAFIPVAARFSRKLQHYSGGVHRGGKLIALQDHARQDLGRAYTNRGREPGSAQRLRSREMYWVLFLPALIYLLGVPRSSRETHAVSISGSAGSDVEREMLETLPPSSLPRDSSRHNNPTLLESSLLHHRCFQLLSALPYMNAKKTSNTPACSP